MTLCACSVSLHLQIGSRCCNTGTSMLLPYDMLVSWCFRTQQPESSWQISRWWVPIHCWHFLFFGVCKWEIHSKLPAWCVPSWRWTWRWIRHPHTLNYYICLFVRCVWDSLHRPCSPPACHQRSLILFKLCNLGLGDKICWTCI